jgi:hypothetical protein
MIRIAMIRLMLYTSKHLPYPRSVKRKRASWTTASGTTVTAGGAQLSFLQPFVDQSRSAANPGINRDCINGTVERAGAALHASVPIPDVCFLLRQREDPVRAYFQTLAAPDAGDLV